MRIRAAAAAPTVPETCCHTRKPRTPTTWWDGSPTRHGVMGASSCWGCLIWPLASTPWPRCNRRRCGRSARGRVSPTPTATWPFPAASGSQGSPGCGRAGCDVAHVRPTTWSRCKRLTRCATISGAREYPTCRRSRFRCWSAVASRTTTCTAAGRSALLPAAAAVTPGCIPIAGANGRPSTQRPRCPSS
ncbi:Uncharacterised protein [Mycobacterium tuberculosis]|uniref:Uncharacterized protein n=1 Tax=Mycobacterium tuberculosis TaxID=1773 RepID=A0A0U0R0E4_MYCTX|nr:Uncharacterised protein [Mycobacterium tuberculosis]CFE54477.1 Uncharacterised protein [Mycobacterium tuberculosis]CKS92586.1 Uncharacterised protein [Mycobacterium tuberculosis]CKT25010.1 Uncharacterised protein [Mycobacterium tuberculosis]CKW08005.1 Uncharacterised protein [Mycobacterium tuberculosis]